ncbi:MAG: GTP-binding protein, partial [Spirochaetia bacterium]
MNVLVVSGFLGSGKTTFLLGLARHLLAAGTSVAVIENEVGQVAIDGSSLRSGAGVEVRELFAGCICCSLREDLGRVVEEIREATAPEVLLIEPSGVAGPEIVTDAVRDHLGVGDAIATVQIVDAARTAQMLGVRSVLPPFLERSVEVCDFVILNKADGMDAAGRIRLGEWLARRGREDAFDLDARDERAVGEGFLPRWESVGRNARSGGPAPRFTLGVVHDQLLADCVALAPLPREEASYLDRLTERVVNMMEAVGAAACREMEGCTGHLKARLDPPGIMLSITDRSSGVTRSGEPNPRAVDGVQRVRTPPEEVVLRVQAIYSVPGGPHRSDRRRVDIQAILDRECAKRLPEFVRESSGE